MITKKAITKTILLFAGTIACMRWIIFLTISVFISSLSSAHAADSKMAANEKKIPPYIYSLSSYMAAVKQAKNLKELIPYVTDRQKTVILATSGKKASDLFNWLRICSVENPKIAYKNHKGNSATVKIKGNETKQNGKVLNLLITYKLSKEKGVWKVDHPTNRQIVQRKTKRSSLRVSAPIRSSRHIRTK